MSGSEGSPSAEGRFGITGLSGYVNRLLGRLAAAPQGSELRELHHAIHTASRRLEISLSNKKLTPRQLTPTARSLRAWLVFLADEEELAAYVRAVGVAKGAVEAELVGQSRWKPPVRVYFKPMRGLYHGRQRKEALEVSLPTAAVCFDEGDFRAVGRAAFRGDRAAKRHLLDRMQSEAFQAVAAELDALGGAADDPVGRAHHLGESFDRVNAKYFAGQMRRPKLVWSRSPTFRKFGHYDWIGDAVMLSRSLDAPGVPAMLVDYIMYHELLHKAHGLRWSGTRGYAHTAVFYRDEKKFEQYDAAEAALKKLAQAQRRRG